MKPKTMILMVVAVGCGLAASYMTSKLLSQNRQAPQEEKVIVLISKTKVPKFTPLKEPEKYFEQRQIAKSAAPKGDYCSNFAEIKDKKLNKDLKPEVHVSKEDLDERSAGTLDVPVGYGAISIKVTAAQVVSGFVWPGHRVDILLTRRGAEASSQTILRDVLVLAVGEKYNPPETKEVVQVNTVSVALKPDEAQLVRLAETLGELSLYLRKPGDETIDQTRSSTVTKIDDLLRAATGGKALKIPGMTTVPTEQEGPLVSLPLPEVPKVEKTEVKPPEPKQPEKKEPETPEVVKTPEPPKPDWTITIYPGFEPPVQQHYFKQENGGITRDEVDPGSTTTPKPKKETPASAGKSNLKK